MKNVLVMGSGKIGQMIAMMLAESGDYHVTVADCDPVGLAKLPIHAKIKPLELNVNDDAALNAALTGQYAVLSALPFALTTRVARAAVAVGVHYFDLTEDVACTRVVKDLAQGAETALVPQCGLAPGFISICAHDLAGRYDHLQDVKMRVGALPKYPANAMKYALTWSTEGLINEYLNPCEAVVNGALKEVPPLEELETFSLDGVDYEAFNTSGGLGTLCETFEGKVNNLNYRTVRYPGHRDILKLLLQDLRLGERPELVKIFLNPRFRLLRKMSCWFLCPSLAKNRAGLCRMCLHRSIMRRKSVGRSGARSRSPPLLEYAPWLICWHKASSNNRAFCGKKMRTLKPLSTTGSGAITLLRNR